MEALGMISPLPTCRGGLTPSPRRCWVGEGVGGAGGGAGESGRCVWGPGEGMIHCVYS